MVRADFVESSIHANIRRFKMKRIASAVAGVMVVLVAGMVSAQTIIPKSAVTTTSAANVGQIKPVEAPVVYSPATEVYFAAKEFVASAGYAASNGYHYFDGVPANVGNMNAFLCKTNDFRLDNNQYYDVTDASAVVRALWEPSLSTAGMTPLGSRKIRIVGVCASTAPALQ
jgi:hypothetical protein